MLTLLTFCLALSIASALDVSWLPADPEGPLPVSKEFRDKLRSLCNSLSPSFLSSLSVTKRDQITKMCAQLAVADSAASGGNSFEMGGSFWLLILAGCLAAYFYRTGRFPGSLFQRLQTATGKVLNTNNNTINTDRDQIRAARVRKFAQN